MPGPAGDHRDQGREDDRVVARVHPGEGGEVVGHRAGAGAGLGLGPGVDHLQPGGPGQRGKVGTYVGVAGVGHGEGPAADPAGGGDGFLGHDPSPGADGAAHPPEHDRRVVDVHEDEPAEGEIDRFGEEEILGRLGDGEDLALAGGGGGGGGRVAGPGIAVDGVHPSVPADDLGQGDAHVAPAGAHVGAQPTLAEAEAVEGGHQGTAVDVAAEGELEHLGADVRLPPVRDRAPAIEARTPVRHLGPAVASAGVLNVTFHGVRGSAPVPAAGNLRYGTHTACVVVESPKEPPIVLDLGSGLRRWEATIDVYDHPLRAAALLTHLHWGHVQGLPDFAPLDDHHTVLDVFGPPPDQGPLARVLADTLGPPWFRDRFDEKPAIIRVHDVRDEDFAIGDAKVKARSVPHGAAVTNAYRIERDGVTIAYVPDHDAPADLDRVDEGVLEVADGVDLLVHDAQLSAADWPGRARRGHSTAGYAVMVAKEAGARRLALFHHDPDRGDDELDRLLDVARHAAGHSGPDEVLSAYEGLTVSLESACGVTA